MSIGFFPLSTTIFKPEVAAACLTAFEQAVTANEDAKGILPEDVERLALATGIVVAATLGQYKVTELERAAHDYLALVRRWALQVPAPIEGETDNEREPRRYEFRAEYLRAAMEEIASPMIRNAILAICTDYERMAAVAKRLKGVDPR